MCSLDQTEKTKTEKLFKSNKRKIEKEKKHVRKVKEKKLIAITKRNEKLSRMYLKS